MAGICGGVGGGLDEAPVGGLQRALGGREDGSVPGSGISCGGFGSSTTLVGWATGAPGETGDAGRSGGFNGRVLLVLVAEIPIVVLDVREDPAALRAAQGPPAAIPVWSVLAARVTVLAAVLFDEAKARTTVRTRKGRRLSHVAASMHGAPHKSIRVDCWTRFSVEAFLPTAWLVWALPP